MENILNYKMEVIGLCYSCDDNVMIIVDENMDDVEMVLTGSKHIKHFKKLVGFNISFYYDAEGMIVRKLDENEVFVRQFPSFTKRTLKSMEYRKNT